MKTYKLLARGRVQGVGFRYTCTSLAKKVNVFGSVKNLANGDVEIILQGEGNNREEFITQIKNNQVNSAAQVESLEVIDTYDAQEMNDFQIRY
ncbi:acylphosphatase [Aerococcus kribbianus]|uniref:acylphosphatase n=1 Tax=Aerococcus kribbianus TaxID=2999064 RepID=A0A9X3JG47_9LACT|nr:MULTISPECIES: acylphosphatase [unclassified Aerococcus]MCZ0717682.1 acylphosphatase [Aerococcus sp. YH-aer221]MCZ0725970.1 acylphosphatase [Aerococcus sp. YH-aer222]